MRPRLEGLKTVRSSQDPNTTFNRFCQSGSTSKTRNNNGNRKNNATGTQTATYLLSDPPRQKGRGCEPFLHVRAYHDPVGSHTHKCIVSITHNCANVAQKKKRPHEITCIRTAECVRASLSIVSTLDVGTTPGSWPQDVINNRSYTLRENKNTITD